MDILGRGPGQRERGCGGGGGGRRGGGRERERKRANVLHNLVDLQIVTRALPDLSTTGRIA